jgi:small ligand-binding sensory domain FIST
MPFASALSEHPITSIATGEVVGAVLERLGERPDLVVLTVTAAHRGALDDVVSAVDAVLHPLAMIGCAAGGVVGTGREVEDAPCISLWAGRVGPLLPLSLRANRTSDGGIDLSGWPTSMVFRPTALVLVADPFTFPTDLFLEWLEGICPGLPVVGGNASVGGGPGASRLVGGDRVLNEGAVGVLLGPGVDVETVVSQGARPYGKLLTVTASERNIVQRVAGVPALECLVGQITDQLTATEMAGLESNGFHVGRLIDERLTDPRAGDFLVRSVVGVDHDTGAMAVDDRIPVGTAVRFHLRDPDAATADLRDQLAEHRADGVLLFTCAGRGTRFFDVADHDAAALADFLGAAPTGGCFAAGEFGPVGSANFVHSFTASAALFCDR